MKAGSYLMQAVKPSGQVVNLQVLFNFQHQKCSNRFAKV